MANKYQLGLEGKRGYVGGEDRNIYNELRWGGSEGDVVDGYLMPGTSGADRDVDHYRRIGQYAQTATGPLIDQTQANETRGLTMGSLASLQNVAQGRESAALRMGTQQAMDARNAQRSMAASVRGGAMARAAAARAANRNMARSSAQIRQSALAGQAQEMANARGQLMQGSSGLRGQDLGLATSQAQLEAQQRALNERQQQDMERLAWDTRNADMQGANERKTTTQANQIAQRRIEQAEDAQTRAEVLGAVGTAAAVTGTVAAFASDERKKTNIVPVGSLAHLMR